MKNEKYETMMCDLRPLLGWTGIFASALLLLLLALATRGAL